MCVTDLQVLLAMAKAKIGSSRPAAPAAAPPATSR